MAGEQGMVTMMRRLSSYSEMIIAAVVLLIISIIIIPIPPLLLDVFLTINITFSLIILLNTFFTRETLDFSVFPTLLLVTTLFRLALNIASTKLILSTAQAGEVIQAFGNFVVGNNYVVGFVVFLIITIIQFVVITNGAGRVAEVSARFTLDAMPGKQMSIDADLNGGLISEDEARTRRRKLQLEADFFGSMDGASKFVKGDAIAGIVITAINILAGFVIGMVQLGMPAMDSLKTYTMLSVGDGLVSQVPALLISTATGILVTRSATGESFGKELSEQLTAFPKVLALAGSVLVILGLVPGLPTLAFLTLGAATLYIAFVLAREERAQTELVETEELEQEKVRQPENVLSLFQVDPMEIEIGYNLIPLTDDEQGGDLLDRLAAVRRQCAAELGIFVRPIRIRDNLQLGANTYVFKLKGVEVAQDEVLPGHYLAMNPADSEETIKGILVNEPTFGLPAWWITPDLKDEAEIKGYTVVDCTTVLITHLTEFIKANAADLIGRQEVKEMIDTVKEFNPAVVDELIPDLLSYGEVQKVLQNLLAERIPIRNIVSILESLADSARVTKDFDYLTETARQCLKRTISKQYAYDGKITVITLHPELEQTISEAIQQTQNGSYPILSPDLTEKILERLNSLMEQVSMLGLQPVLLCSSRLRLPMRRLVERFLPNLAILSLNEITPDLRVESAGMVIIE